MRKRVASLTLVLLGGCEAPARPAGDSGTQTEWTTASPASVGLDGALLERSTEDILAGRWGNIHAFLVVRRGKLVHEAYFAGRTEVWFEGYRHVEYGPDVPHELRSVSKSFTSTLVGIAIDQGFIESAICRYARPCPSTQGC